MIHGDHDDVAPNPRRLAAVKQGKASGHVYIFADQYVFYSEYGGGAEIVTEAGYVVADFVSHLCAEKFLDMCVRAT